MLEDKNGAEHNLFLQGRRELNLTGIKEVKAFDEETVVLDTSKGTLTIKGENLAIESFSAESGDLKLQGNIWALVYSAEQSARGMFRRILK